MTFDMNAAWSRAMVLARENFSLLTVIAGIFLLLPTVAIYLILPDMATLADPTANPDMTPEQMVEMFAPVLGWLFPIMLIQFVGYNAMVGLMGSSRPTVGQALGIGVKAMPSIIAAFVIFMVVYMLASIIVVIPVSILTAVTGAAAIGALAPIMILAVAIFLATRLSLTMPVVLIEATLNPFKAMKRSWDLTGPQQWRVMGFWAILVVAYIVILLLVSGLLGLIAAMAGGGLASGLILGLSNGAMAVVVGIGQCALAVSIYNQLAGPNDAEAAATFD
ncbi:glycerophosphoryl diester phosphodiesterase membrane domain-containing protein [Erythrobacter crassostreae]|uniref:Glycerophosphoryl diester phosphodiesterase membrane domain-containing protein n=1 Tax=Erythrobacter crassostreae TaxID=2828328 RepID=A0A9X1F2K4_9SPHN|nr:glycerophosphoryl diester phosphodiesterase membrane domain-containing protein [Erythrobacter crassostrea]MBV7259125.1 glycerophosphoryl diester phosphodiesterase membrane domain-containing protein [Erythrobacter crassostrea]